MSLYRHVLVWTLRAAGAVSLLAAILQAVVTVNSYDTYNRGEPGMTYLLDMMVPLGLALVVGALVALALAEILALQIKRVASA